MIVSTHTVWDLLNLYDGVIALSQGKLLTAQSTWEITRRLAFVTSQLPPVSPLYVEQQLGLFRAIVPADPESPTNLDFTLLYNALQSQARDIIISMINKPLNTNSHADI